MISILHVFEVLRINFYTAGLIINIFFLVDQVIHEELYHVLKKPQIGLQYLFQHSQFN